MRREKLGWSGLAVLAFVVVLALPAGARAQDGADQGHIQVSGDDDPDAAGATEPGPPVTEARQKEALLMTLGAVAGQGLMLTCTSIATLADAYVEEVYAPEQAAQMAADYLAMTDSVRMSLTFLKDSGMVVDEDEELLTRILEAYGFLHNEIEAFQYFVETGDPSWVKVYEENRDKAWAAVEALSP